MVRFPALAAVLVATAAILPAACSSSSNPTGKPVHVWLTTADGAQTLSQQADITPGAVSAGAVNVRVDDGRTYQTITGFGSAFTDSSAYLLAQLKTADPARYTMLMTDLTTESGIAQTVWRVPMGASDFTATDHDWTSDEVAGPPKDPTAKFALTPEETQRIIPVLQDALAHNPTLQLVASPWSPPAWMKTNNSMICKTGAVDGTLRPEYRAALADYFVKWITAYQRAGVPIWAVTPQNEPEFCTSDYPGMTWSAAAEADWVHNFLRPALQKAGLATQILGYDHNWDGTDYAQGLLNGAGADLAGMAWHCYDGQGDPAAMTTIHNANPTKDTYLTECSSDTYPTDIIRRSTVESTLLALQNWAKAAILWNPVLDQHGGPHLGGCKNCTPLVTVTGGTATRENNYYQFGQVSKFVQRGAARIRSTVDAHGIVTAAVRNPDGHEALIATNTNKDTTAFTVTWNGRGSFTYPLPSRATVTFVGEFGPAAEQPNTPLSGHVYEVVGAVAGKRLTVAGTGENAQVVQDTDNGDPLQHWRLVDAGDGYYTIIDTATGMALDNPGGGHENGTPMRQRTVAGQPGSAEQQWQLTHVNDRFYTIVNRASGYLLDLRGASVFDQARVQQRALSAGASPASASPSQMWEFLPAN